MNGWVAVRDTAQYCSTEQSADKQIDTVDQLLCLACPFARVRPEAGIELSQKLGQKLVLRL
jgi:hypothetical protein